MKSAKKILENIESYTYVNHSSVNEMAWKFDRTGETDELIDRYEEGLIDDDNEYLIGVLENLEKSTADYLHTNLSAKIKEVEGILLNSDNVDYDEFEDFEGPEGQMAPLRSFNKEGVLNFAGQKAYYENMRAFVAEYEIDLIAEKAKLASKEQGPTR